MSARTMAARLAIAFVAGSVIRGLLQNSGGDWLLLVPQRVLTQFAIWQPLTYAFIDVSALGVVFGAIIIWSIGGTLEASWGGRRLLAFAIGVPAISAVLTVLAALVIPSLRSIHFAGGWVLAGSLWVAYGLAIGRGQANFWGMPLTGNMLALIGAGFVFLGIAIGPGPLDDKILASLPTLIGLGLAVAYSRGANPRILWLKLNAWRLARQLKARSRHLRVVGDDQRNMPRDSDRYLH